MQFLSTSVIALLLLNCLVNISAMSPSERRNSKVCSNATHQTGSGNLCLTDCICRDGRDGRDGRNGKDGRDGRDGRNAGEKGDKGEQGAPGDDGMRGIKGEQGLQGVPGDDGMRGIKGNKGGQGFKGQKGESGSSLTRKHPGGIFKFNDVPAFNCTLSTAGTVRYNVSQNALQFCDGRSWLFLLTAVADTKKVKKGHESQNPGRHCLDILNAGDSRGSGLYWIDPNGGSKDDSFQAFCDMDTNGGGWTLVATKVSPSFLFIKTAFSTSAAKTTDADAASHIHTDMGDWEEVMFRFSDVSTIRVIYDRKAGAPNKDKTDFDKFLMGTTYNTIKNVHGFYKYSPADKNKKNPPTTFASISSLYFYAKRGISEVHRHGTDKWLDIWDTEDNYTDNYIFADDNRARGTKCIAGYCYLNKPIWVMVR